MNYLIPAKSNEYQKDSYVDLIKHAWLFHLIFSKNYCARLKRKIRNRRKSTEREARGRRGESRD